MMFWDRVVLLLLLSVLVCVFVLMDIGLLWLVDLVLVVKVGMRRLIV